MGTFLLLGKVISSVRLNPEEQQQRDARDLFYGGLLAMASGQCSPSDTLDSGTGSDLDGTPPPLPKKMSSVTMLIGNGHHERAGSLTSSGADVDSDDNESNVSCDSLNNNKNNNNEEEEMASKDDERKSREMWRASPIVQECTYEERRRLEKGPVEEGRACANGKYVYEDDRFYKFHLNECRNEVDSGGRGGNVVSDEDECFAGVKILERDAIRSDKGTVRGVKNRVRAGIATFLQQPMVKVSLGFSIFRDFPGHFRRKCPSYGSVGKYRKKVQCLKRRRQFGFPF